MNDPMLDPDACRGRQVRLLEEMRRHDVEIAVVTRHEHVQWLTGFRPFRLSEPAAALWADGRMVLVAADRDAPPFAAIDDYAPYEGSRLSTWRNDQRQASTEVMLELLSSRPKPRRVGVEFSCSGPKLAAGLKGELFDLEPALFRLRRRKDADELAMIKKAISGTGVMYRRAREIIRPGVNELDVYSQLQAAATEAFGEPPTGTGNDYACGARGGPPRDRPIEDGELYILDLGPAFQGYFADNCRTFAANGRATDEQQAAWQELMKVFPLVETQVKPGCGCRELYNRVKVLLDEYLPDSFTHHLGHGIGLAPHEGPHVNSQWDDTFEIGDVFTIEPGLYAPELRAGIRLENDYLVTADRVELLSDFPLEL